MLQLNGKKRSIQVNFNTTIDWLKQEITNSLTAIHNFMQCEIDKFVDRAHFLRCCPEFVEEKMLPIAFDEVVLEFDNSLVGEEPYSLIEKIANEAKRLVAATSNS